MRVKELKESVVLTNFDVLAPFTPFPIKLSLGQSFSMFVSSNHGN